MTETILEMIEAMIDSAMTATLPKVVEMMTPMIAASAKMPTLHLAATCRDSSLFVAATIRRYGRSRPVLEYCAPIQQPIEVTLAALVEALKASRLA